VSPDESVLSEYNPEAPPNPNPPPYTLLRFNEDYTYLADPRNRTDPFDPVKYIPLDPDDPKTYLSFGGELRERFEHFTNPGFGVPPNPDDDDYLRQRIAIHGDLVVEIPCVNTVTQADAVAVCTSIDVRLKLTAPAIGQHVSITGPYVNDGQHGWMEIHPVYEWHALP